MNVLTVFVNFDAKESRSNFNSYIVFVVLLSLYTFWGSVWTQNHVKILINTTSFLTIGSMRKRLIFSKFESIVRIPFTRVISLGLT